MLMKDLNDNNFQNVFFNGKDNFIIFGERATVNNPIRNYFLKFLVRFRESLEFIYCVNYLKSDFCRIAGG